MLTTLSYPFPLQIHLTTTDQIESHIFYLSNVDRYEGEQRVHQNAS